jgi:hypothetical protein
MKQRLFFALLVAALLVLAVGGWTVLGLRRAASGRKPHGVPHAA